MTADQRALRAFLYGHRAADRRQRALLVERGPQPSQAVAESLAAANALEHMGMWPGPRSKHQQLEVDRVRRRWARIEQHALQAKKR
jgi:hypothetical protein